MKGNVFMKKYRVLVTIIIVLSIVIIGTSNDAKKLYKASNLIIKSINVDEKKIIMKLKKKRIY